MIRSGSRPTLSAVVGREADLDGALAAIEAGARLVTLTGPPGVGKTTLLRLIAADRDRWAFCDLLMIQDPDDLVSAVARALHFDVASVGEASSLGDAMRRRGRLDLALDHAESLSPAAARVLSVWLDLAPSLRIVASSRVPLGLPGEELRRVDPLAPPEALELFVARARRIQPEAPIPEEAHPQIAAIVARLDGLPLAIELAAARLSVLSLDDLTVGLRDRFAMLRAPRRPPQSHHVSLWSALELSWSLLSRDEREMLGATAVFRGGFGLEAADAILGEGGAARTALDRLQALQEHSLVMTRAQGSEVRFDVLESIRDFGLAQMTPETRQEMEDRHGRYYVETAERELSSLYGPARGRVLRWLSDERLNLLVAEQRFRERDPELAARTALALYESVCRDGPVSLAAEMARAALASAERTADTWLTARALGACGKSAWLARDTMAAIRMLERAVSLADRADRPEVVDWQQWLVLLHGIRMDYDAAERWLARSLEVVHTTTAVHLEAVVTGRAAYLAAVRGDAADARAYAREAVRLAGQTADPALLADAIVGQGEVSLILGESGGARRVFEENHDAIERSPGPRAPVFIAYHLCCDALLGGDVDEARRQLLHADELWTQMGHVQVTGTRMGLLGILSGIQGDFDGARACLLDAVRRLQQEGHSRNEIFYATCLAAVDAGIGQVERARGRADQALRAMPAREPALCRAVTAVAGFIAVAESAMATARGRAQASSGAIDVALEWWGSRDRLRQDQCAPRLVQQLLDALTPRVVVGLPWQAPEAARPVPIGVSVDVETPSEAADWVRALRIAEDASRVRLHGGALVDLRSREALRSVLAALVHHRVAAPGAVLPPAALGGTGGKAQLQTTVRRLRDLGLRDCLLEHGGGYALDPALAIVRVRRWP